MEKIRVHKSRYNKEKKNMRKIKYGKRRKIESRNRIKNYKESKMTKKQK